ncbi:quinol monooxygenase YgiN [Bacillus mesophilus]|uniref:Antibiotic biosynthesis monooxygenase n=1 Tax=Bacillus mesophilus TaxID=1808955 RepID=A0A6M0Q8T9_9BACI|nr:putative quinol monooxygenase [Bacillus mesophilus]MBM7661948.1 quinol monooxygenase YgiN [Bacillus mesophilus]NEY72693.1 antibiotic biosynthesis monooxygenase [Bacillus mesophilus]
MIVIHAHILVKSEHREGFLKEVANLVKESQAEQGNISYQLYEDTSQANKFVMLEEWKDADAVTFHFNTPHFKDFGKMAQNYFQEAPRVAKYEVTNA